MDNDGRADDINRVLDNKEIIIKKVFGALNSFSITRKNFLKKENKLNCLLNILANAINDHTIVISNKKLLNIYTKNDILLNKELTLKNVLTYSINSSFIIPNVLYIGILSKFCITLEYCFGLTK